MVSIDYVNTFIAVEPDSTAVTDTVPSERGGTPIVASRTWQMIADEPCRYTSGDVIFTVYAERAGIARTTGPQLASSITAWVAPACGRAIWIRDLAGTSTRMPRGALPITLSVLVTVERSRPGQRPIASPWRSLEQCAASVPGRGRAMHRFVLGRGSAIHPFVPGGWEKAQRGSE